MGDKKDPSFDAFMKTVLDMVADVNTASQAIGSNGVLLDNSKEWKDYKHALDKLQDTIKKGQHDGNGKKAVKNCICEFVYKENPSGGGDAQPLYIKGVRLRGWVKVSPAAQDTFSSSSDSSGTGGGGGGG